jgi:integrase
VPESSSTSQQPLRLTSEHALRLRLTVPQRFAPSAGFAEYAQWWLDEQRRAAQAGLLRPNTIRRFESALRAYLLPFFGGYELDELSRSHCEGFRRAAVRAGGLTPRSVNSIIAILRLVLRRAVDDGILTRDPTSGMRSLRTPPYQPRCYSMREVDKLITALPAQWRALVGVAAFAGLRQGEALALRPQDIDLDHNEINVTRSLQHPHPEFSVKQRLGPPKSPSAMRSVPIRPHLAALLEPHLAEHVQPNQWQLLFSRKARPILPIWFHTSVYAPAINRAGMPHLRFHDLRHTFVSHCAQAGVPLAKIARWVGHSNTRTTEHYYHTSPASQHHALNQLDQFEQRQLGTTCAAS